MFFRMSVARHLSGRTVDILVGGLIAVASAALLAPAFLAAGSEFDEGIIVSFPSMIIRGEVPYRDFESFYGPGGAYSVAGAFELFGSDACVRTRCRARLQASARRRHLLGAPAVEARRSRGRGSDHGSRPRREWCVI